MKKYAVNVEEERNSAMKKVRNISILMMLSLVLLAMTACGGSGSTDSIPEDAGGAEPETNATMEIDESGQDDSVDEDRAETDISPEFKATMDSYEEFFDEYVEFMQKYNENPTDTEMMMELSNMMTKEADMLKKLEAMDQSEMTTAEAAYYLEVTARINKKLASVL